MARVNEGVRPTQLSRERVEQIRTLNQIAIDFPDGAYLAYMDENGVSVEELSEAMPHAEGCSCGECPSFPWEKPRA